MTAAELCNKLDRIHAEEVRLANWQKYEKEKTENENN